MIDKIIILGFTENNTKFIFFDGFFFYEASRRSTPWKTTRDIYKHDWLPFILTFFRVIAMFIVNDPDFSGKTLT